MGITIDRAVASRKSWSVDGMQLMLRYNQISEYDLRHFAAGQMVSQQRCLLAHMWGQLGSRHIRDLHGIANDDTVLGCLIETLALLGVQASDQP